MSRFITKISRIFTSLKSKPVGHDLQGNRYFEIPSPNGGRTKRTVDYAIKQDLSEYANGDKLPVQWVSWLSHTRSNPPTLSELESDLQRRYLLQQKVALINARDAEEVERRRLGQPSGLSPSLSAPIGSGGGGDGKGESVLVEEETEGRIDERLERLSSGSPPSPIHPSTPTPDPHPSSPPYITHSTLPTPAQANSTTSPTLRELSQLVLERQRKELEKKGVDLEVEAERLGYRDGSGTVEAKERVTIPTARRRGGSSSIPSSPLPTTPYHSLDALRSIGQSQIEFDRAQKEMNKSVLDGIGPLFDAKSVVEGKETVGGGERTREETKADAPKEDAMEDPWATAKQLREKGE